MQKLNKSFLIMMETILLQNIRLVMKQEASSELVQIFTKIQEAQPSHFSTLLNKQVGYFVHVQNGKTHKIKNCVDSEKTNAELYKRFSKAFINNLRKGKNQMVICCGLQENARMETSIGCQKNPGMFLIAGIGILDQKYQEDFTKFDIEISFMEYADGHFYDLLTYTKMPLKMVKKDENICFGQTYCKIATFSHFLKLFKIALFNNKERDSKISASFFQKKEIKIKSTIIMTIVTKKYFNFLKNTNPQIQKNVIIDFAGSQPSEFKQQNGQRSVWDYFLIELNNLSYKKKLHYHLVEPNPLLCLTKSFLKNGKTFLLNSFSANPQLFESNYKYLTDLYETVDSIQKQSDPSPIEVSTMNSTLKGKQQAWNENLCGENQMLQSIVQTINSMLLSIKNKKYSSLRHYREIKQKHVSTIGRLVDWIQIYKKIYSRTMENKRILKLYTNQMVADQLKLIGVCVKSENYKDFYEAKSYLSLEREIDIKTQEWRQEIIKITKQKYEIKDKFNEVKTKHHQFMDLHSNQTPDMQALCNKIEQFFTKVFFNLVLHSQRTIADEIIKQQNINENLSRLHKNLMLMENQICCMGKNGNIYFQVSEFKKDGHLAFLVKEVQSIMKRQRKNRHKENKKGGQEPDEKKKHMIDQYKIGSGKFTRLPALSQKTINFQIPGNFSLASLLLNPTQLN